MLIIQLLLFLLLLVALGMAGRSLHKEIGKNGVRVWNVERKSAVRSIGFLAIPILIAIFASPSGFWGVLAVLTAAVMLIATIIAVIELPANRVGDWIDRLAWGDPAKPIRVFAPVVWTQIGAAIAFVLFASIFWIVTSVGGGSSSAAAGASAPSTTSTSAVHSSTSAAPATSSAPQAAASASAPSAATKYVDSSCDGPKKIPMVDQPTTVEFGTGNLQVCYNGKWQAWADITSNAPPRTVRLTAWVEEGEYGYGQVDAQGREYVIRTTDF
jgi:hypothetical protein